MKNLSLVIFLIFMMGCARTVTIENADNGDSIIISDRRPAAKIQIDKDFKFYKKFNKHEHSFTKDIYIFFKYSDDNRSSESVFVELWNSDKAYRNWSIDTDRCRRENKIRVDKREYNICAVPLKEKYKYSWGKFDCDIQIRVTRIDGPRHNNVIMVNYFKDIEGPIPSLGYVGEWEKILEKEMDIFLSEKFDAFKILE